MGEDRNFSAFFCVFDKNCKNRYSALPNWGKIMYNRIEIWFVPKQYEGVFRREQLSDRMGQ